MNLRFLEVRSKKVLEARARLLLDLHELQQVCRPSRTWVTREEWIRVWGRDREWDGSWPTAKRALMRRRRFLEEVAGVDLVIETIEDGEHRIYVDTQAIRDLIEPHLRRARILDELVTSARRGVSPDLSWKDAVPNPNEIANDYGTRKFQFAALEKKYGLGRRKLRKILERQRERIRPMRRMRVTDRVSPEVMKRALEEHDNGGTSREVAKILGTTHTSALKFLRANGRDTRQPNDRAPPARIDPPWRGRSATCA